MDPVITAGIKSLEADPGLLILSVTAKSRMADGICLQNIEAYLFQRDPFITLFSEPNCDVFQFYGASKFDEI